MKVRKTKRLAGITVEILTERRRMGLCEMVKKDLYYMYDCCQCHVLYPYTKGREMNMQIKEG